MRSRTTLLVAVAAVLVAAAGALKIGEHVPAGQTETEAANPIQRFVSVGSAAYQRLVTAVCSARAPACARGLVARGGVHQDTPVPAHTRGCAAAAALEQGRGRRQERPPATGKGGSLRCGVWRRCCSLVCGGCRVVCRPAAGTSAGPGLLGLGPRPRSAARTSAEQPSAAPTRGDSC